MPVTDVSTAEFADKVLVRSGDVPVVVDFWAAWCGPCRVLGPILERAATEAGEDWELVKVDVDQNQQLAAEFGVQGIPTVIGFRDGRPVARFTGALPEPQVRHWLRELVPSAADRLAAVGADALQRGDTEAAEAAFRQALESDRSHLEAGTELGRILVERGDAGEAIDVLAALPENETVRGLRSQAELKSSGLDVADLEAKLADDPGNLQARLDLGRALAADGEYRPALDHLIEVVGSRSEHSEPARLAMLDLFVVVPDADLVAEFRRRLASALF
jgi:putative thioredoxin